MKQWKHSVISGGGSGLGLGLAQRLLRRGGKVTVLDLAVSEASHALLNQAAAEGQGCWQFIEADIRDDARMVAAVNEAVDAFGEPDLAINSAGIAVNKTFAKMQMEEFRRVIDINLNGSAHFAHAVLPHLKAGSRLALMASMAGLLGTYAYTAYGASKFGVVGLATTLRNEYAPLGIAVSCICPPEVKTPLVAAERVSGDPISLALKQFAGSLETDPACDQMLAGLDAGDWQIIPGKSSKLLAWSSRHFPGPSYAFTNFQIRRLMRKHGRPTLNQN